MNKPLLVNWEKKSAEVVALERATLYGLVVYSGRRTPYSRVDLHGAREIFIREALVGDQWETKLPFLAANHKMIAKVEELEHKSRRQDVLVDDAIIAVEMMVRKMEEGYDKVRAATFAYEVTAMPMLTGTLITAAGFLPIGIAKSMTGEYTFAIFAVTVIALVLSWFVSK